ncbi:unnamed protein product [Prorocentrum cordatum]|uniref:Uncharacterized protein n=1 Tax=Prorocentrum cordatum TaxID=2364126 RepID=A0ABN9TRN2_9DINO|nr:unnamed protein product [Polarella glacialis]
MAWPWLPARPSGRALPAGHAAPSKKTPPSVRAAVLRTWANGWCAGRRFGARRGWSAFGCRLGDEDIRHYVCCPKLWRFEASKLGLVDPGALAERTTHALLWQPGVPAEEVAGTATMVAVGYKAHAAFRHAAGARLDVPRLLAEVLAQLQKPQVAAGAAADGG